MHADPGSLTHRAGPIRRRCATGAQSSERVSTHPPRPGRGQARFAYHGDMDAADAAHALALPAPSWPGRIRPGAIAVEPVTATTAPVVRRLRLRDGQQVFTGSASRTLDATLQDPDSQAMAIVCRLPDPAGHADGQVVGCYRLDFAPIIIDGQSVERDAVSLRSLMIDQAWQARGVATQALAACCADLQARYPGRRLLALAVHAANTVALQLYRRAGFVDTGSVLADTSSGLQRILLRRLDAAQAVTAGHGAGMGQFPP